MRTDVFFDNLFAALRLQGVREFSTIQNDHHVRFARVVAAMSRDQIRRFDWPAFFPARASYYYDELETYIDNACQRGVIRVEMHSPIVTIVIDEHHASMRLLALPSSFEAAQYRRLASAFAQSEVSV